VLVCLKIKKFLDGSSTVAYRFAANQAIYVSPWIQKSRVSVAEWLARLTAV